MEPQVDKFRTWIDSFLETAAGFVDEQPLLASIAAVVLVALFLYLLAKLARAAALAVVVIALLCGVLVYTLGPDQARSYLDQIRDGAAAAER